MSFVIEAKELCKSFDEPILHEVDFRAQSGESIAIVGPSGCGKSTLLHILGGIERPERGSISILGKKLSYASTPEILNRDVGYLFQSFHLLDDLNVLQNITLPAQIGRTLCDETVNRSLALLDEVGMKHKATAPVKVLSGGEKQRVALVRALCNNPSLLLCDEPTGNLDPVIAEDIQSLLLHLSRKHEKTVIVVTHNLEFAQRCDTMYTLEHRTLTKR